MQCSVYTVCTVHNYAMQCVYSMYLWISQSGRQSDNKHKVPLYNSNSGKTTDRNDINRFLTLYIQKLNKQ